MKKTTEITCLNIYMLLFILVTLGIYNITQEAKIISMGTENVFLAIFLCVYTSFLFKEPIHKYFGFVRKVLNGSRAVAQCIKFGIFLPCFISASVAMFAFTIAVLDYGTNEIDNIHVPVTYLTYAVPTTMIAALVGLLGTLWNEMSQSTLSGMGSVISEKLAKGDYKTVRLDDEQRDS